MLLYQALRQQRPRYTWLQQGNSASTSATASTLAVAALGALACSCTSLNHAVAVGTPRTGSVRTLQTTTTAHALAARLRHTLGTSDSAATAAVGGQGVKIKRSGRRAKLIRRNAAAEKNGRLAKFAFPDAVPIATRQRIQELEAQVIRWRSEAHMLSSRGKTSSTATTDAGFESGWGPDRLIPDGAKEASSASSDAASSSKQERSDRWNDRQKPASRLLQGAEAVEASLIQLRDARGRLVSPASYSGPIADEKRKWTETLRGSVRGNDVLIEKVEPLRKMDVPALAHGLDRVLFNPGIYWLRDPRSGIYNFDPRIRDVLDVDLFDYEALTPYVTSSQDPELAKLTKKHQRRYCGSTSSMTGLLSQCYFHISGWRDPDTTGFSAPFQYMPRGFSMGAKLPASIVLNYKEDGHYAIDADKTASGEAENNNYVLTSLGKSMEKMLTSTPEEYAKYMRINSATLTPEERNRPESYHYAQTSKLMMRSQLDCQDDRLPRRTFDLKTRASVGIRNDRANYVEGSGYQIRRATGLVESFEREYYDMIRAAFLKYNFQARIGHMDGIFVAYHTTSTIYGFQYISVEEMNERLFGSEEMADQSFKLCLGMLENILDAATNLFPKQTLKITIETKERADQPMSVFVEGIAPVPAPDAAADSDSALSSTDAASPPVRTIAQLDVTLDRYLDHQLVAGPVDFTLLPGRMIDPMTEDEITRRMRLSLPPAHFDIDFTIDPRPDLSEAEVRRNLEAIRERQRSLSSLIIPNLEAVKEREEYRERMLQVNPEALRRFREERRRGEIGMPLAPGQEAPSSSSTSSASASSSSAKEAKDGEDKGDAWAEEAGAEAETETMATKEQRRKAAIEARWLKLRNAKAFRLRELAKLGAKDAAAEANEMRQMFTSRSWL
ncbi:hypothetical protein ACQY0O_005406 [Thecaphora frezii]